MPHYNTLLLSSWSSDFVPTPMYFPPPAKIPQQVLSSIKVNDSIAYATLPKELRGRRNVVATAPRKTGGRFRSGKRYNDVGTLRRCVTTILTLFLSLNRSRRRTSTTRTSSRSATARSRSSTRSSVWRTLTLGSSPVPPCQPGADSCAQVLQSDVVQRVGDAHPQLVHERARAGHALLDADPPAGQVAHHDGLPAGALSALRARVRHAHARGREGNELPVEQLLQDGRRAGAE